MGENFNGNIDYVAPYQNYLTGVFNYPMYFTMRGVWQSGQSMYNIRNTYDYEGQRFKDIDALGVFVDNHDNARFLNGNSHIMRFKNALTFSVTSRGIPFVYYGGEQGFTGGNDPYCRETLWDHMNTKSEMYNYISTLVNARKSH